MHDTAHNYVAQWATDEKLDVLDVGGRDINGTCRDLFPNATYTVLDLRPGLNVDIVADAATWTPDREYDLAICTEVFEHAEQWRGIVATAHKALKKDGRALFTCAGPGRTEHSGIDEGPRHPGEYYGNLSAAELAGAMIDAGFNEVAVHPLGNDLQATGRRTGS